MVIETIRSVRDWPIPEGEWRNEYYLCMDNDKEYAHLHLQFTGEVCYMHLYMSVWSLGTLRTLRKDFEVIKEKVAGNEVTKLVGMFGAENVYESVKWMKFINLLGFDSPKMVEIGSKKYFMIMMEV